MSVFTSMDKLIGPDFDEGLNNLAKVAAEDAKTLDAAKKAAADAGTKAAAVPPPAEGTPPPSPAGIAPPMPTAPAKG